MKGQSTVALALGIGCLFAIGACSTLPQNKTQYPAVPDPEISSPRPSPQTVAYHPTAPPPPPPSSGAIAQVPWEDTPAFVRAKQQHGTPLLLAAFSTVLKSPRGEELENIRLGAGLLSATVVMPGETFSQNERIGPYTEARGFKIGPTYKEDALTTSVGGGICKVASTLYNVTVLSNLKVVERHPHAMPVLYVPFGQDATVGYGSSDFKFLNDTQSSILIWAETTQNVLSIGFYGNQLPPKVAWHHEISKGEPAKTLYKQNSNLEKGQQRKILKGIDGMRVSSWLIIGEPGLSESRKALGTVEYKPLHHIVEKND